jgi:hypothetical protein
VKRFLALWLVLASAFALTRAIVALALAAAVDLRFPAFVELIVVPGVQAAAVSWALRARHGPSPLGPWLAALVWPAARIIAALELAVLIAAWVPAAPPLLHCDEALGVPRLLLAVSLAAAAALWARAALQRRDARTRSALAILALALAVLAIEPLTGWLEQAPGRLFPTQTLLVRWLRFEPPLLLALLLVLLAAQATLARERPLASRALDWVLALLLVVSATLVIGFFLHPYLREPWHTFAWTTGAVAANAAMLGGALAGRSEPPPPPVAEA